MSRDAGEENGGWSDDGGNEKRNKPRERKKGRRKEDRYPDGQNKASVREREEGREYRKEEIRGQLERAGEVDF